MSPITTRYVIICSTVLLVLYNLAAAHYGGREATISDVLYRWSCDSPIIAAVCGVLLGHWFWR